MEDNITYSVIISPAAEADIDDVYNYITFEAMAPETAIQYYFGIYDAIKHLSVVGAVLPVSQRPYLRKRYGMDVRTVNYKKMTIIYNIVGNVAYVQRVMASSLIR
jgi:plasmid stabilization system protein ParE